MALLCVCNSSSRIFDQYDHCPLNFTAQADYYAVTTSFTFTSTVTKHNVTIPLVNDNVAETTEHFFVNLRLVSSTYNVEVISPDQATVNIKSEDGRLPLPSC